MVKYDIGLVRKLDLMPTFYRLKVNHAYLPVIPVVQVPMFSLISSFIC